MYEVLPLLLSLLKKHDPGTSYTNHSFEAPSGLEIGCKIAITNGKLESVGFH